MKKPSIPENEEQRLKVLKKYQLLDTLPEDEYDEITTLASQICGTPISLISLIDGKRQWFKSRVGLSATETAKEFAFCAHAINDKDNIFIIPDSRKDERFYDNPLVTDDPNVIFYAGIPLVIDDFPLGTLCVIDNKPNNLNEFQCNALKILSNQVIKLFELRLKKKEIEENLRLIQIQNEALEKFANIAAHDMKSPLVNLVYLADIFTQQYKHVLDENGLFLLNHVGTSSNKLIDMVNGILAYTKNQNLLLNDKMTINIEALIKDIFTIFSQNAKVHFSLKTPKTVLLSVNKVALERILLNLFDNAIKYNDKEKIEITVVLQENEDFLIFNIIDNGLGIEEKYYEQVFQIFQTTTNKDKQGDVGTGIGLASVKSLVEGLGGEISIIPTEIGTNMQFTIKK